MKRLQTLVLLAFLSQTALAQEEVPQVPDPVVQEPSVKPLCDILAKMAEPDPVFAALEPEVGTKSHKYHETRRGRRKQYNQPEKQIGLRVLHLDTCTTEVITMWKKGSIPVSPEGWHIQVDVRHNGIQWNGVNSQFDIEEPSNVILLENKLADTEQVFTTKTVTGKDGKKKKVKVPAGWRVKEYRTYSPYTFAAHRPELVAAGDTYLREQIAWAINDLRERGVQSQSVPGTLVADQFPPEWIYRLALNEHMDFGEFNVSDEWRQWSAERVLVLLALNRERTNIYNCNFAGACGLYQFTDGSRTRRGRRLTGTYTRVVRRYPDAGLNPDFLDGANDHRNIIKAAILHHDMIQEEHVKAFGLKTVLESQYRELALGVGYNGGFGRSNRLAIQAAYVKSDPSWWRKLRKREAREYTIKGEFLKTFQPNGAPLPPTLQE